MVMDTTSSTGRWLSAERATKMFDRLSNLGATYVELRAMSCDSNVVRLRDGSMDAAVPAQDLGVTLRCSLMERGRSLHDGPRLGLCAR